MGENEGVTTTKQGFQIGKKMTDNVLEAETGANKKDLSALKDKIDSLEVKVESKMDSLKIKMDSKMDSLDSKMDSLESKMDSKMNALIEQNTKLLEMLAVFGEK